VALQWIFIGILASADSEPVGEEEGRQVMGNQNKEVKTMEEMNPDLVNSGRNWHLQIQEWNISYNLLL
jgi:hypothetical protein